MDEPVTVVPMRVVIAYVVKITMEHTMNPSNMLLNMKVIDKGDRLRRTISISQTSSLVLKISIAGAKAIPG